MAGQFCLNPYMVVKRYDSLFQYILNQLKDEKKKKKLTRHFNNFKKCIYDTFITYYSGKLDLKPKHSIENAAILNKMIKPIIIKLTIQLKKISKELADIKSTSTYKNENIKLKSGGDDMFIFINNNNGASIDIFPSNYKFSWEKNWKWYHWLLLVPILDFLIDTLMAVLWVILSCFGSFFCAMGLLELLTAISGGGNDKIDIVKKNMELFPILIAYLMAAQGKSVNDVVGFLSRFNKPRSAISMIISLTAASVCIPSHEKIQHNINYFVKEIKVYKYQGDNNLIKQFVNSITKKSNNTPKISKEEMNRIKIQIKQALISVIRK